MCDVQMDARLTNIGDMTVTMEILTNVKIGKTVSRLAKLNTLYPMIPECEQIARKARYERPLTRTCSSVDESM